MRIKHLVSAEPGWKVVFKEPDGTESMSRVIGWAVADDDGDQTEVVGVIVDPAAPSQIVVAPDAVSPAGGAFSRYRYVAPEPIVVPAPPPPPPPEPDEATKMAKSLLKRKR
jgi:hypothetical protein